MSKELKKIILKQIVMNSFILLMAFVIYTGVSYSMKDEGQDNKDILMKTGNMQVVLSIPNNRYEFTDTLKESVSDIVGLRQEGYNFSVQNIGNIPIEYYEIRLVNEENKISSLPHKYLRFTISKDSGEYDDVKNLGDMDSIIYSGYNLDVGKTINFNLKMWLEESSDIFDKELYAAMEITLYQKFDIYDNYILYDSNKGVSNPSKTSIYNYITTSIPKRDGYTFLGWSSSSEGKVEYESGSAYKEKRGKTLYAVWKINE